MLSLWHIIITKSLDKIQQKNVEIMNSNTKFILGIIAAGAVGVAIGMLLAPEKGSDLRKSIRGTMDDLGEKLADLISEGKDKVMNVADTIKSTTHDIKEDVQTTVEHGKKVVS
jgi:gas vesicle protein